MQKIFQAAGCVLYTPGPGGVGMESTGFPSPKAAMTRLLNLLQVFVDYRIGDPEQPPEVGLHVYPNDLVGGYLVLAMTDRGASVYSIERQELSRMNLPIPARSLPC